MVGAIHAPGLSSPTWVSTDANSRVATEANYAREGKQRRSRRKARCNERDTANTNTNGNGSENSTTCNSEAQEGQTDSPDSGRTLLQRLAEAQAGNTRPAENEGKPTSQYSDAYKSSEHITADPASEAPSTNDQFIFALGKVLDHLVARSGEYTLACEEDATLFDAVRPPQITIHDYLMRIQHYFNCSRECFVLSLIYIDRLALKHPEFTISRLNIHRLVITAIMLAVKFFDDVFYTNSYYAKVGGVRTREMNGLESQFLQLIGWKLYVSAPEYEQYMVGVQRSCR